jgi:type IV secretory pathway VirB10-like protein
MQMRSIRTAVLIPVLMWAAWASTALAQWSWRDENGRPVYSDVPPPAGVKAADILQRPPQSAGAPPDTVAADANAGTSPAAAAGAAPSPSPSATYRPQSLAERELAFQKRQKERADAEKKQADQSAQLAKDSENCTRAQGYLRLLEDGGRVTRTNADGSRELLDADQRASETARAKQAIEQSCH